MCPIGEQKCLYFSFWAPWTNQGMRCVQFIQSLVHGEHSDFLIHISLQTNHFPLSTTISSVRVLQITAENTEILGAMSTLSIISFEFYSIK